MGFEEGNIVTKDTILYKLDSSDFKCNLKKVRILLNETQRSYEKAAYAQSPRRARQPLSEACGQPPAVQQRLC